MAGRVANADKTEVGSCISEQISQWIRWGQDCWNSKEEMGSELDSNWLVGGKKWEWKRSWNKKRRELLQGGFCRSSYCYEQFCKEGEKSAVPWNCTAPYKETAHFIEFALNKPLHVTTSCWLSFFFYLYDTVCIAVCWLISYHMYLFKEFYSLMKPFMKEGKPKFQYEDFL